MAEAVAAAGSTDIPTSAAAPRQPGHARTARTTAARGRRVAATAAPVRLRPRVAGPMSGARSRPSWKPSSWRRSPASRSRRARPMGRLTSRPRSRPRWTLRSPRRPASPPRPGRPPRPPRPTPMATPRSRRRPASRPPRRLPRRPRRPRTPPRRSGRRPASRRRPARPTPQTRTRRRPTLRRRSRAPRARRRPPRPVHPMDGARTRGHAPALAAIEGMVRGGAPHALLLSGPGGVGKTTLAMDLAAGLLCVHPDVAARPCRSCRGCRLLEHGDHPDLHRLAPAGPGGQVVIGGPGSKLRGVRELIGELVLMPLEGTARVAMIEAAHRMNDDAQAALLKTLEEPPAGLTLVLCADDEDRLLPTVRARCARIRLGPVGVRDIEAILGEHGVADPPLAARLARLAAGRPGAAIAYARAPEAVRIRGELARTLLDLLGQGPARRLVAMREAIPQAMAMAAALDAGMAAAQAPSDATGAATTRRPGKRGSTAAAVPTATAGSADIAGDAPADDALEAAEPGAESVSGKKIPAAAR